MTVQPRPGVAPFTVRTPRVVAARRLHRRRDREETGRFLAEGPQAVREALRAGLVVELFGTAQALARHPDLSAGAYPVTDEALGVLAETVAPQGLVAVCTAPDVPLESALARQPRLVAVLVEVRDPGNAGTAVDPYNGKCVRASAGSLFHVDLVRTPSVELDPLRGAGLQVLAADPYGDADLDGLADTGELARPTAWLFGSEAHGLPDAVAHAADRRVRVPIHGQAESLNLAAAAAVCLYASARALR
ncbi:MAG: RNA methyltransferase [Actinobacteria bacterium]|nr:MAG: RNA methyltransferase [Actinomycetota bacterium]